MAARSRAATTAQPSLPRHPGCNPGADRAKIAASICGRNVC